MEDNVRIVTGLWHVRQDRPELKYLFHFKNLLALAMDMTIYVPREYLDFVLDVRKNVPCTTEIKLTELSDVKNKYFNEHWDAVQRIRCSLEWKDSVGWLKDTPQSFAEWYNPIVMSKVYFTYDAYASMDVPANRYVWVDAGITQHIPVAAVNQTSISAFARLTDAVTFASFDYSDQTEVHGFSYKGFSKYTEKLPSWVCRATLFSSTASVLQKFRDDYRYYLTDTLARNYMGTEESIFTLLSLVNPTIYKAVVMGPEPRGMPIKLLQRLSENA